MRCFERLGHGELSPDQAIQTASQAIAATGPALGVAPGIGFVDEQALCRCS